MYRWCLASENSHGGVGYVHLPPSNISCPLISRQGVTYLDNLQGRAEVEEKQEAVTFGGEVDRIYRKAPNVLQV